jgi:ABC-2 type transport system permease protein
LLARRELRAYLRSPLGSVIIAGALLIDGLLFYFNGLTPKLHSAEALSEFFFWSSGPMMIAAILLSMRLVAEERQTGSMTLLNTSPIRDRQIVLGKFLSALAVLSLMVVLTVYMPLWLLVRGKISLGHILVGYTGTLLLGSASLAIGLFASSLTRSQVLAAIFGALVLVPLLVMWMLAPLVDPPLNTFLSALAIHHLNFRPFMQGILDLGGVVYYLAVTAFFLLAATKSLEARRWR